MIAIPWGALATAWRFRTLIVGGLGLAGIGILAAVMQWRVHQLEGDLALARGALADCTARYELAAERLKAASAELVALGRLNRANDDAFDKIRADHQAVVAELTRELAAVKAAAPQIVTLEKVIHARAKECPAPGGVPASKRELYRWLRDHPDASVGGAGGAGGGARDQGRAPGNPGRPTPLQPRAGATG